MSEALERLGKALAGRYRVERELGAGGMATVYLAHDERHERRVAIKVLRPDLAASLGAERFHREIRIAAALQHPHILPLYDSGEADGLLFYVMPYVEGTSLRQKLLREGELPVTDAVRILRDVADALAAAHQHGVVHRDLKPENVMLSGRHALVTDFGVAKAVSESTGRQSLTTLGVALGTPTYMAPEQATADPHLDHRADIYAFGVLAYELLAGRPPFSGLSPQEVLAAHVTSAAEPVTKHRSAIPPGLSTLVMRCLEKRPADRWQNAEELIPQLEAVLTPSGGLTPTDTRPLAPQAPARRLRTPMLLGGALVAVLSAVALSIRTFGGAPAAKERTIAVIPFENLAGDTADRSFILGVHGEIVTQLSRLQSVQVASRSSSSGYLGSSKTPREIASELGVATLLTGSVQRAGGRVRLQVGLDDAERGRQIWGESFDRELTAENLFAIQGEVARAVANALSLTLSDAEAAAISTPPTSNLEALDLYHSAEAAWLARGIPARDSLTIRSLERAVSLDSSFARAWSLLAQARSWELRSGFAFDTLPAWRAVQRASALSPGSLETHLAGGYYHYYAKADYERALAEFREADRLLPNSSELANAIALLLRRLGRWEEALTSALRAARLDPRSHDARNTVGDTYLYMGYERDALIAYEEALAIAPSNPRSLTGKFFMLLSAQGDSAAARAYAATVRDHLSTGEVASLEFALANAARDYTAAIRLAHAAFDVFTVPGPQRDVMLAVTYKLSGDPGRARAYADSAVTKADALIRVARRRAGDPFGTRAIAEIQSAVAMAAAGDTNRAIARGERAAESFNEYVDAIDGAYVPRYLAMLYVLSGRHDDAIVQIRRALDVPQVLTPVELKLDPVWDPLRNHPVFRTLVADRIPIGSAK